MDLHQKANPFAMFVPLTELEEDDDGGLEKVG